jgi:hypothetical protein
MLSLAFYKSTFCISAIIVLAAWPDDFDVTVLPKTPWLQMHRKYVKIFSLLEVVCLVF